MHKGAGLQHQNRSDAIFNFFPEGVTTTILDLQGDSFVARGRGGGRRGPIGKVTIALELSI